MSLETPECEAHGGSSHARGKRPPAVEINSPAHIQKLTHPLKLFLLFLRITWRGSYFSRTALGCHSYIKDSLIIWIKTVIEKNHPKTRSTALVNSPKKSGTSSLSNPAYIFSAMER